MNLNFEHVVNALLHSSTRKKQKIEGESTSKKITCLRHKKNENPKSNVTEKGKGKAR